MVVKSATKKRLMELGVEETLAHKLATDRNMNDIKAMTSDEVAIALGISKEDDAFQLTMNVLGEIGARRKKRRSKKVTISKTAVDDDDDSMNSKFKFNVLNHHLVPHQEIVPVEMEEEELAPWGLIQMDAETGETRLAKELLPKILITDPVVQTIKEMRELENEKKAAEDPDHVPLPAGWLTDRVVKVIRKSPSSGKTFAYILIVEGS